MYTYVHMCLQTSSPWTCACIDTFIHTLPRHTHVKTHKLFWVLHKENLQEEAVPRRAGEIHGDPPDTEAPKYTQSTALCYIGERHTNTRTRSFSWHRQRRETKEMHFVCPKRCENRHCLFQMQSAHLQGTYIILLSVMCISDTKWPIASYLKNAFVSHLHEFTQRPSQFLILVSS